MSELTPPRGNSNRVLEGRLEDVPLADIIQVLQVGAKTGALLLSRDDGASAILAFRNGAIIQAMCTQSYQSLGERLIGSEAITRIDLQEGLNYMAQFPGMRVGDALVELGHVTRGRIEDEVKAQMTETVEQITSWKDAEFEFRVGFVALPRGMPEVAIDLVHEKGVEPRHLLLEASLLQDKRNRQRDLANRPGETPLEKTLENARKGPGQLNRRTRTKRRRRSSAGSTRGFPSRRPTSRILSRSRRPPPTSRSARSSSALRGGARSGSSCSGTRASSIRTGGWSCESGRDSGSSASSEMRSRGTRRLLESRRRSSRRAKARSSTRS